jgi:hypothetical protein
VARDYFSKIATSLLKIQSKKGTRFGNVFGSMSDSDQFGGGGRTYVSGGQV